MTRRLPLCARLASRGRPAGVPQPAPDQPLVPTASVTVVIPTRDEEGLIGEIIESVRPYADEVLVVDGHSRDRTREIAAEHGVRVILDRGKGKGDALRLSIDEARSDILVFIDADGSHDPKDIPLLVGPIQAGKADLVIASRQRGGSDELHGTLPEVIRYLGSQTFMLIINYRWGTRLTDSQNGFRAIRTEVARSLGLTSNVTTIEQEMLMKALKQGYRVSEIASHEYERKWGVSKVVVWKLFLAYGWNFFRNIF